MKNNLKQYQAIKTNLLKEWSEKDFERINKHILYMLKANLSHNTIIEHGHEEKTIDYTSENRLGDVFGLPYTSSGDFAGVWNTNTQTVAKYGKPLYFRGVAVAEDFKTVILFEDKQQQYYYFYDYDFITYQEQERRRQKAREWGELVKNSNIIKNKCIEILKPYEGKPYGEKTAQKIGEELRGVAVGLGLSSAWLDSSKYGQGLKVYGKNNKEKRFYFNFLNDENKITTPTDHKGEAVADVEEFDTVAEFEKAGEFVDKMKKKAGELLKLIEEFKTHATRANYYPKETQNTYSVDLENISRGRISWEG